MSIKVSSLVWEKFPHGGSEMLCMLAMADWSNDQGGSLHPSISRLAKKMRVSDRQAQRTVQKLIQLGYISVVGNLFGGKPGTTRQYQINLKMIETGDTGVRGDADDRGDTGDAQRVTPVTQTGDADDTQYVSEPLGEPSVKKCFSAEEFEDFWKACLDNWYGNTGTKKEAKAAFLKLKRSEHGYAQVKRLTILECQSRKRQNASGQFAPAMKHVCRWIKYAGWQEVSDRPRAAINDPMNEAPKVSLAEMQEIMRDVI